MLRQREHMKGQSTSQSGFSVRTVAFGLCLVALAAALVFFVHPLRQFVRESFMQRASSAHYEILSPASVMPLEMIQQFASQRESLFTKLSTRLGGSASNAKIRIVFESATPSSGTSGSASPPYTVTGETIRAEFSGQTPQLDPAADAEAILYAAWGNPGDPRMGRWAAGWLVGEWRGEEIGMAAAGIEQRLGHKSLSTLLDPPAGDNSTAEDRDLLGAAWLSEVSELDRPAAVHKLYSTKFPSFDSPNVARVMETTTLELDRKWQMWIYSYIAGMPSAPNSTAMPMGMPMQ